MVSRTCNTIKDDGQACRAAPLQDGNFCLMHDPAHAEQMAEARRLGGERRRWEKAVSEVYVNEGLENVSQVRRLLESP